MLIDQKWMQFAARMSSMVIMKALLIGGGAWAGFKLDKKFDTEPYLLFAGVVLGTALGFFWLFYSIEKYKPKD